MIKMKKVSVDSKEILVTNVNGNYFNSASPTTQFFIT